MKRRGVSVDERYDVIQPDGPRVWLDVESARLTIATRVQSGDGWTVPRHSHECWEFLYFLRGTGSVVLPSCAVRPQPYHLIIYPPGLSHEEWADPFDPEETICLQAVVPGVVPARTPPLLLPDSDGNIRWLCEQILAECQLRGITSLANAYLKAFLLLVERIWETGVPVEPDLVDIAVRYMNCSYSEDIDPKRLSDVCHASECHIARRFNAKLGISPMQYLMNLRIEAVKRLLVTTDISINKIATQIGFNDPLYLSRVFKHVTGHSPSEYRSMTKLRL